MFGNYNSDLDNALGFIKKSRATGTFNFSVDYNEITVTSDDIYTGLEGTVTGSFNGYITTFEQLIAKVWTFSDVEYKAVWQYEVNNAWYNWDTNQWIDEWVRDSSIGDNGLLADFAPVDVDGKFGGLNIIDTKLFESTSPYLTYYPDMNDGEGGYAEPHPNTSSTRDWKRKFLKSGEDPQVRVHRVSDDYLLGSLSINDRIWHGYAHYSFLIEPDSPDFDGAPPTSGVRLNTRCWVYTEALIVMAYTSLGLYSDARETLKRLALEQYENFSPAPQYNGAWGFSFDVYFGRIPEQDYVRNGAVGWVAWAFLMYKLITKSTEFDQTIIKALNYLRKEQIQNKVDTRYGLVPLGWNRYSQEYFLEQRQESACALEHNVDIWQVFRLAYTTFQDETYKISADILEKAVYDNLLASGTFYQGISPAGIDEALALDCNTWGGNFKLASQNFEGNKDFYKFLIDNFLVSDNVALDSNNPWYEYSTTVYGFKPYVYGMSGEPQYPWIEGSLGAISSMIKSGYVSEALSYIDDMILPLMNDMTNNPHHGLITMTTAVPEVPWEFNIWLTALNSAWLILTLRNNDYLWTSVTKKVKTYTIQDFTN